MFLAKLQNLPLKKKKIILWSAVVIIALVLLFFWAKDFQKGIRNFQAKQFIEDLNLPQFNAR